MLAWNLMPTQIFDHSYLFKKVNIVQKVNGTVPKHNPSISDEFLCDQCGQVFLSQGIYSKHIENNHQEVPPKEQLKFQCRECTSYFHTRSDLNYHVSENHNDNDIECEQCGKYFVSRLELADHKKKEHTETQNRTNENDIVSNLARSLQIFLKEKEESPSLKDNERPDDEKKIQ